MRYIVNIADDVDFETVVSSMEAVGFETFRKMSDIGMVSGDIEDASLLDSVSGVESVKPERKTDEVPVYNGILAFENEATAKSFFDRVQFDRDELVGYLDHQGDAVLVVHAPRDAVFVLKSYMMEYDGTWEPRD